MLAEIENTRQIPGEGFRRWFTDAENDLIIWYKDDDIIGFQFCYDKVFSERAITWFEKHGFSHMKVDDGEPAMGGPKRTPVLVSDGVFDFEEVAKRFKALSAKIDADITDFVYGKMLEYPGDNEKDSPE